MSSARRTKKATGVSSGASEQPGLRECVQKRLVKDVFEQASGTIIQAVMYFHSLVFALAFPFTSILTFVPSTFLFMNVKQLTLDGRF